MAGHVTLHWSRRDRQGGGVARLQLITKSGCHLCEDARAVVSRVCDELHVDWEELPIEADPRLAMEYFEAVPVVRLDGRTHAQYRVDEARLRAALG